MTDSTHTHGARVTRLAAASHPLDPLTPAEISAGRALLQEAGLISALSRFPSVVPVEPAKPEVLGFVPGDALHRRILFVVLEPATGVSTEHVVNVSDGRVESSTVLRTDVAPYGQPPYLFEEYERVDGIVKSDQRWIDAMTRRGITDWEHAFCGPLAPGYFERTDGAGRRLIRSLTFLAADENDSPWAHPVEGLLITIDLTTNEIVSIVDEGDIPTAATSGNFDPATVGPARTDVTPIVISQPEGPSFSVDGAHVTWLDWTFRVGFNAREGLVLNQVNFADGGEQRPVVYRASVPEMVVPYGDTSVNRYWISYFDAGEYHLGKNGNPLALGCDCLGVIHYFDVTVADDHGQPMTIPQGVCMHEEDYGVLWKHTDMAGNADSRRSRRLVISYFSTIGNYDYGFFWYFYPDGTIEMEAKATGVVFNGSGIPGSENPHAREVAPGLFAPIHQHLFCARLDMNVDSQANSVEEVDVVRIPTGPDNPYGNAFTYTRTPLRTESEGVRDANGLAARSWHIRSAERTNALGQPTEYQLVPQGGALLMAQPDSSAGKRATFAQHHLWVTAFHEGEYWPAGQYPNQHAGGDGLPSYVDDDESIEDTDLVLWHTFGPTHLPRPEDWPVMPVDYSGFMLKPYGFFDRNPALTLPRSDTGHAAAPAESESGGCGDNCRCGE